MLIKYYKKIKCRQSRLQKRYKQHLMRAILKLKNDAPKLHTQLTDNIGLTKTETLKLWWLLNKLITNTNV